MAQIIILALTTLSLGIGAAKHGEPRKPHNFLSDLVGFILLHLLLWWGGFYNNIKF